MTEQEQDGAIIGEPMEWKPTKVIEGQIKGWQRMTKKDNDKNDWIREHTAKV